MTIPRHDTRRWWRPQMLTALLATLLMGAAAPLCLAAEPVGQTVDADWILARMVRPLPSRTPFVELRDSPLLKTPLRVEGEYRRPSADVLVRDVRAPYAEVSTIANGQVRIERAGHSPRTFSLSRAPELAALQAGFGALLAGDDAQLRELFGVASQGVRKDWTLTLTPRDAGLAGKLEAIILHGRGSALRCIETRPVDGAAQRTLLADAAQVADDNLDANSLTALCVGAGLRP